MGLLAVGAQPLTERELHLDLRLEIAPEPLLAPPYGKAWVLQWSSEDPRYGGGGTPAPETTREGWHLTARSAAFMRPAPPAEATERRRGE